MRYWMTYVIAALLWSGCSSDAYFGPVYTNTIDSTAIGENRLLVGCEGNFMLGNASLSLIDLSSGDVQLNAFEAENNKGLGDVLQGLTPINDTIWATINNSGLIRLLADSNLKEIAVIDGLTAPRHTCQKGGDVWVSDLFAGGINVIDRKTLQHKRFIEVKGWTEHMVPVAEHTWVANIDSMRVHVFDPSDVDHILPLDFPPQFMYKIADGQVFIAGTDSNNQAQLRVLNAQGVVITSRTMPQSLRTVTVKGEMLAIVVGKTAMIMDQHLQVAHHFEVIDQTPYGLNLSVEHEWLFVADAKDYASQGTVHQYDYTSGTLLSTYKVGYIPQAMLLSLK